MGLNCLSIRPATISEELRIKTAKHPCYSFDAQHQYARMHLPVAPDCNISCNYCNRKFDCVNESRPGVTSEILTPESARDKFIRVKREMPNLSVVGIAGPGDALANWDQVKQTIGLIKEEAPDVLFCLSTNGLMLPRFGPELVELGIKHVTVTVNCLNPAIGAQIYHHVNYEGNYYTRERAAEIIIKNQQAGIKYLADRGVLVKVNIVMIKDLNGSHILEVVRKVKRLGAWMTNIMPLIPAPGSVFEALPQTSMKEIHHLRGICQLDIPQMTHCRQCRADAIGLLAEDQSSKYRICKTEAAQISGPATKAYQVAVTSKYRQLVDLHYGHAEEFQIYLIDGSKISFVETRKTNKYCGGTACDEAENIKEKVIKTISDCDAILTMRIGDDAQKRLRENGIFCFESCESVAEGLKHLAKTLAMKVVK
jgi:nitrogen fixation protein NifB